MKTTIPQFIDGQLTQVEVELQQFEDIILSRGESEMAVRTEKNRLKKQSLTTIETIEALRRGRQKKYYRLQEAEYWKRVNRISR